MSYEVWGILQQHMMQLRSDWSGGIKVSAGKSHIPPSKTRKCARLRTIQRFVGNRHNESEGNR